MARTYITYGMFYPSCSCTMDSDVRMRRCADLSACAWGYATHSRMAGHGRGPATKVVWQGTATEVAWQGKGDRDRGKGGARFTISRQKHQTGIRRTPTILQPEGMRMNALPDGRHIGGWRVADKAGCRQSTRIRGDERYRQLCFWLPHRTVAGRAYGHGCARARRCISSVRRAAVSRRSRPSRPCAPPSFCLIAPSPTGRTPRWRATSTRPAPAAKSCCWAMSGRSMMRHCAGAAPFSRPT